MGLANIIEQRIQDHSQSFWTKVGTKVPDVAIQTQSYNRGFVNFCMLAGLIASVKLSAYGIKKLHRALTPNKALPKAAFLQRYGEGSWALIADVANNEQYCLYLAKQGLNLILMGELKDIMIVRDMISVENSETRTITYPIDWSGQNYSFDQIVKDIKDYDISFLVLPRMPEVTKQSSFGTHVEEIPPFEHFYLLVRYVAPQLQWRSYQSAIILPSWKNVGQLKSGHGVKQGINSALDCLMRTLNFEMRNSIDVIAARGTTEQCFKDLGKQSISE